MDSRERTYLALEHRPADRIPVDFWASGAMIHRLEAELRTVYDAFLDAYDVDLRYIPGPLYVGPPLAGGCDIWGVRRTSVVVETPHGAETYSEVAKSPLDHLATVDDILRYPGWPSPDAFDYAPVEEQCRRVRDAGRVVVFMGDRLNRVAQLKPAMYLRGIDTILLDLVLRPEMASAVLEKIRLFYLAYLERVLEAAHGLIDIVVTGDDFGAQNGLLISPETWREFLQPGFAEYIRLIHTYGAKAMHHTCGSVVPIIPDMIACGLDVLQSVQPEATGMDLPDLMAEYGDRLCFQGGISIQRTLPFGTPDDVRRAVARIAEAARPRGGYIFGTAHNIQADTPTENVLALMEAYREFG